MLQCRAGFPPNLRRDLFKAAYEDTRPLPEQRSAVVQQSLRRRPIRSGKFRYSNLSYIAGAPIDRVAQTSFEDALQRYVLQPLGVATAGFGAPEVANDEPAAHTGDPIWAGDDLVGVVTSGANGHTMRTNIAMGYVAPEHAEAGTELAVDIIGVRSPAVVRTEPMFDPAHERPRA